MTKSLPELFNEAYADAAAALIPARFSLPQKSEIYVLYNERLGRAWGHAQVWNHDHFTCLIKLSKDLCQHTNENSILNTMIHEIIHCCGIWNHKRGFKLAASLINKMFPGKYNVSRCTSANDKMTPEQMLSTYKYVLECPHCGMKYGFKRFTRAVEYSTNGNWCWCSKCKKFTGEKYFLKRVK